ncbi:hypothetical protein HLV40_07255 [Chromohalobacter salexigens]|uniref:hypothetical protein n=1 Tax=Chromohalobacter TaxID=42054 RepID=UPI0015C1A5F0|nr:MULTISPECIES: hypothetical protein [Chromohalobacter]MCK2042527.1 hypothetical protein [Chromohalobacter moromii]MCT8514954.1 hypothetical protein [Chromohalobacter sp. TMW 2.2271]NWO10193.1 hypothetical protein [Chromohalobacter salexigens]
MAIEIEEIDCNGSPMAVAKGHHDLDEFRRDYAAMTGDDPDDMDQPRHTYMRKTPPPDGWLSWMTECQPGRGAFPVTVMGPM